MLLNKYKVKSYTFKEFKNEFTREDITLVEMTMDHIKENKVMYTRLVVITALLLHFNMNFVFANELATSLDNVGNRIMGMLLAFAKWACIGMGVKNMSITLINGGNMKQALTEGIQYWIGYLFIQYYPQLFEMFNGIKF